MFENNRAMEMLISVAANVCIWSAAAAYAQVPISSGQAVDGRISVPMELDTFTFHADANDRIELAIGERSDDTGAFKPWIRLYDPNGFQLGTVGGRGDDVAAGISEIAVSSGIHTVAVADLESSVQGPDTGDYRLNFFRIPGSYTVTDDGGELTSGGNHEGAIDVGDLDAWSFEAEVGDQIHLSIGEITDGTGNFRPWIRLYAPDGATVGPISGAAGDRAAGISITAGTNGTYTLIVSDIESSVLGPDTGEYRLHFFRVPGPYILADDGGDMIGGVDHEGAVHVGDLDAWSFEANAGDPISVQITELSDDTGEFRPWIRLFDPVGGVVGALGGAAGDAAATLSGTAGAAGTYTVIVADIERMILGPDTGTYRLVVEGVTAPTRRPELHIRRLDSDHVRVSWDQPATGWRLMEIADLDAGGWIASSGAVSLGARMMKDVDTTIQGRVYFRLERN